MDIKHIINKLYCENNATKEELIYVLDKINEDEKDYLIKKSDKLRTRYYDNKVYMRGLIEFTNYCVRNCKYCGIRSDNSKADRYRLSLEEILECVAIGNRFGYKTFVLQGGEDPYFTDERMVKIIQAIKEKYPENAITLSIGERSYESYKRMFEAGADRYLLRHETATKKLYESLHPNASYENRVQCLYNLKEIGYEVGAGFMIGLPNQSNEDLVNDLLFIKKLNPHMCGIGPFIPQKDTPLRNEVGGTVEKTMIMLALLRLMVPKAMLPATTALGSIDPLGREKGLKAGANVVMPNLSPKQVRDKYALYDGKICTGDEAAECRNCIERRINLSGYKVEIGRGDSVIKKEQMKVGDNDE
ncbi:[FeFe] hydrogenase H-cluster radical SAM maturase HydE [uncultured Clostridium sp.]|uniref:[FeFe] hydrogenase H-cluster radical SAM maturase HydE n=1 Tax=uncultured Clostridium sp. TaxID=59620 RepID=UPI0026714F01|nr:[FeFe] hydrogenase H-cluster radical SAM maturase HydE [uncultured Clostridium sp.]